MRLYQKVRAKQPQPAPPLPQPPYAPTLFQLAYITTGDASSADRLSAAVLREPSGEGVAIRGLAAMIGHTAIVWPAFSGTGEPNGRDHRAYTHLWTLLGELTPGDRLGLALHLILNVPRHELDPWLHQPGMAQRIGAWILHAGQQLGFVETADARPECEAIGPQLIDADDAEHGRPVRLHFLGCDACRRRVEGVRATIDHLRSALRQLFPARAPIVVVEKPGERWPRIVLGKRQWQLIGTTALVFLTALLLAFRPVVGRPPAGAQRITAAELIDRSLHRFEPDRQQGVLHEQFRVGTGEDVIVGERWIEYAEPQRMRLILQRGEDRAPLLDLVTDGDSRLQYRAEVVGATRDESIANERVRDLVPILRQLPASGAIGSFPAQRTAFDLSLLGMARRQGATFMGTTTALERPAYLLTYTEPGASRRIVLTIDARTAALLRATAASTQSNGPATTLWETQAIELLPEAPPEIFRLRAATTSELPDPRHLLLTPFSNLPVANIARVYVKFPMPRDLPVGTQLAYLRNADFFGAVQLYEGSWTSALILTPLSGLPARPERALESRAGNTLWHVMHNDAARSLTVIDFAPVGEPTRRSHLYFWHAYMTDEEREAAARDVVRSIQWVGSKDLVTMADRFVSPPAGESLQ